MNETHFLINCTEGKGLVVPHFPCAACGRKVRHAASFMRIIERPVMHSLQAGKCPGCGAQHFVLSARSKPDCVILEPYLRDLIENMKNQPQMHGSSFDDEDN